MRNRRVGVIGSGWVGSSYAGMLEERGHDVTVYSLEEKYKGNRDRIAECDFVFICVPTPTTPQGHDVSIVDRVLELVGDGKVAVIKSTVLPGTTEDMQQRHPNVRLTFSPEFLTEATAAHDVRKPDRNIIGVTEKSRTAAGEIMALLPPAPFERIMPATEAELVKYGGNCWFVTKVLFINTLYELAEANGADFDSLTEAMAADPRIGRTHLDAVHDGGRGAGGDCFVKDFAAYIRQFGSKCLDEKRDTKQQQLNTKAWRMLQSMESYNKALLESTGKSERQLRETYGGKKE